MPASTVGHGHHHAKPAVPAEAGGTIDTVAAAPASGFPQAIAGAIGVVFFDAASHGEATPESSPASNVITVGPSGEYATISAAVAAAVAGDTIDVQAGTYTNDFPAGINENLTLQGVGGMVDMVATEDAPNDKGILDVGGSGVTITINDFSFSGATDADGNGAGIRYEAGTLFLNDDYFHNNQEGMLAAPDPAGIITIDDTEFSDNGTGDGYTHGLYVNEIATLTIENSLFTGAVVGHEIKSRALNTIIENNRIQNGPTGSASYDIDLPNGGNATIKGNVIEKGPDAQNPSMIAFGEEADPFFANSSLNVSDNTFLYDLNSIYAVAVMNPSTITVTGSNNAVYGLSLSQISVGSADITGTTSLSSEPALDWTPPYLTACFVEGTHILTATGERPVETLRPGDLVVTATGKAAPVRRLGVQTIAKDFADPGIALPIRLRAGALAPGVPARDLLLSPTHALLLDGVLVHAAALVNGASIAACTRMPPVFRYYHVELPRHSVIFANGAPAESFLPGHETLPFDNAGARPPAPDDAALPYPRACAARQVPQAIRDRLAARALARAA